jgi:hypothetical protein
MSTNTLQNSFLPTQIPGCQLWLDAADSTSVVGTSPVTAWNDKSGNGYSLTTSGGTPQYVNYGPGYSIYLNNSYLATPTIAGSVNLANYTFFIVSLSQTAVTNQTAFSSATPGVYNYNGSNDISFFIDADFANQRTRFYSAGTVITNSVPTTTIAQPLNLMSYTGTALGAMASWLNGNTGATATSIARGSATTTFSAGGNWNLSSWQTYANVVCNLYEVIIYNTALTTNQRQKVEGYLAWKWGLVASLPAGHPYLSINIFQPNFTNQAYTSTILSNSITNTLQNSFLPTQIPGCQLWVDANDIATVFSDTGGTTQINPGGSVARWNDKSGNNNYLQQATAGSRPVYQNTPGGYNAVYFNGAIQLTSINNNSVTGNTARTMFLIQQAASGGARTMVQIGPDNTTSPPNTFGIDNSPAATLLYFPYVYTAADNYISVSLTTLSEIWAYYDPSVSQIGGYYNFQNAQTKSTTLNTSATPWYFGTRPDTGTPVDSYICECIVYNTFLTTNQRYQVEGYLAWKWGLVASLSAGHPYKTTNIFQPNFTNLLYTSLILAKSITNIYTGKYFSPLSITGAQLWLDAADTSTITGTSAAVTAWKDKSGTANNMSLTAGTATYNSSSRVVNFQSGGIMRSTNSPTITASQSVVFVVCQATALTGGFGYVFSCPSFSGSAFAGDYSIRFQTATTSISDQNNGDLGFGTAYYVNGTLGVPSAGLITVPSGANLIYGIFNASGTTQLALSDTSTLTRYFVGNIQEVIVYTGPITTAQQQQVEGYLAWKWGLQKNLPSTHPYFLFPPPP